MLSVVPDPRAPLVPDWRLEHWCPTCSARPGEPCRPASLTQCHLARGSFADLERERDTDRWQ